ncbi:MAG: hypothetical protein WC901_04430 [Candidatus Margulisiibacteriota bacterium]
MAGLSPVPSSAVAGAAALLSIRSDRPSQVSSGAACVDPTCAKFPINTLQPYEIRHLLLDPDTVIERAYALYDQGDDAAADAFLDWAIIELTAIINKNPHSLAALSSLAAICDTFDRTIDLNQAVNNILEIDFTQINLEPEQAPKLMRLASILRDYNMLAGATEKRIDIYRAILLDIPQIPSEDQLSARLALYSIYWNTGEIELARQEYDTLLEELNACPPATQAEYQFYLAMQIDDFKGAVEALQNYKDAPDADPEILASLQADFDVLIKSLSASDNAANRIADSQAKLEEIDLEYGSFQDRIQAIDLALAVGDITLAEEQLQIAKELRPHSSEITHAQIMVHFNQGQLVEAWRLLSENFIPTRQMAEDNQMLLSALSAGSEELSTTEQQQINQQSYSSIRTLHRVADQKAENFPQSFSGWQDKAFYCQQMAAIRFSENNPLGKALFFDSAIDSIQKAIEILRSLPKHLVEPALINLQRQEIRLRLFLEKCKIDDKPVTLVDFTPSTRIPNTSSHSFSAGPEMAALLSEKSSRYFMNDPKKMRAAIVVAGAKSPRFAQTIHSADDLANLSLQDALLLAATVTERSIHYDVYSTELADQQFLPIEEKFTNGYFETGVCRNYADLFAAIFDSIKEVNPNSGNAYVDYSTNSGHAWNTIFVVEENQITGYVIDPSLDDLDGKVGNNLGGLHNFYR